MASRVLLRSLQTLSNFSIVRLRPLVAVATNLHRVSSTATTVRGFATRQTTSSLNDSSPKLKETILFDDGCDFKHWFVVMEKPEGEPTRDDIIDSYVKTLAMVVGSEEEARMKIYSVSTRGYFAFGALVSEELSYKIKELPGIRWVLPDSYLDVRNKDYGGEPFINGQAVPYDPKYHEEWIRNNLRAEETYRRNVRPRYSSNCQNQMASNQARDKTGKAQWDTVSHNAWIDICQDLVRRGYRPGSHLTKEGWNLATDAFNQKTSKAYTKDQMKNHWDSTKKEWQLWHSLVKRETGLSFDHVKHCIDAPDHWWDALIKKNAKYANFRTHALDRYWDLDELFLDVSATGRMPFAPSANPIETQCSRPSPFHENIFSDGEEAENEDADTPVANNNPVDYDSDTQPLFGPKNRMPIADGANESGREITRAAVQFASNLKRLASVVESWSTATFMHLEKSGADMTELVRQLASLPGYERGSDNFYAACKLFKVRENRALWMAMGDDITKAGWLRSELGTPLQSPLPNDDVNHPSFD